MMSSESTKEHRDAAADQTARCAVLTVSDTRTKETDRGGRLIVEHLENAGHAIADYEIVRDEPDAITDQLHAWLNTDHPPDAIITTGGTGIASRDTTVEVARRFIDKELEGFGELFRMLSWEEVGPAAMLSRAVAGLANETLLFTLPGSTNAVKLAMTKLIIPELPHLIWERLR
ncbi:MAG: molybdenum cofactor biosynthesis protein B [Planctomycetota bacterium]